jgi:hypothetical protein
MKGGDEQGVQPMPLHEKNIGTTWTERKVVDVLSNVRFEFSMCGTFLALTVAGRNAGLRTVEESG